MKLRIIGRILAAQALSSIGTSMSTVALAVMVFRLTGSVLQMGGIMAASTVPLVLTAWVGGAFLDRYSARNIMVVSDLVRAALIFSMPFLAGQSVGFVYLVAALMGIFSGVFNPGQIKLVGEIVPERHLVRANSYLGVSRDGPELAGYLVGGVIASISSLVVLGVHITGYTLAFTIDAISYVVSALMLVGLPRGVARGGEGPGLGVLMLESPRVLTKLWRAPALRTNLLLAVFASGAVMMNVPNSYVLAQQTFGRGSLGLGTLEVFVAAGLILGGVMVSRLKLLGDKNGYMFLSLALMAVCYVLVGFSGLFWVSVSLMGLAGIANVGVVVPSITMFQNIPHTAEKGRLIALRSSFGQLGVALGFVVGGLVGEWVGIKEAFFATGGATILIGLVLYVPYRLGATRRLRQTWTQATQAGERRGAARELARQAAFSGLMTTGGGLSGPGAAGASWAAVEALEGVGAEDGAGGAANGAGTEDGAGLDAPAAETAGSEPALETGSDA